MSRDDYSGNNPPSTDGAPEPPEFDLFNLPPHPPLRVEMVDADWQQLSPSERFDRFHWQNPGVYAAIVKRCREWRAAGNGRLGMSLLFGVIRWELALNTQGDPWKINDHYAAYYSRLVMHQEKDLDGIFEVRRSEDADAWLDELKARAA